MKKITISKNGEHHTVCLRSLSQCLPLISRNLGNFLLTLVRKIRQVKIIHKHVQV